MTAMSLRSVDPARTPIGDRRGNILLLGVELEALQQVAPLLGRRAVAVSTVASVDEALAASAASCIDLLVIRQPTDSFSIDELLSSLRCSGGESKDAFVLVLTEEGAAGPSEHRARRLRFASLSDVESILTVVAEEILGVAPRLDSRLMVQMGLRLHQHRATRFCQLENLSKTGMLLRLGERPEVGERVDVTLTLPDASEAMRLEAEVARWTDPPQVKGVGLRFIGVQRALEARLHRFVESFAASTTTEAG